MFGVTHGDASHPALRAAGIVPFAAAALGRRRLGRLAPWVVHAAPPPADGRDRAGAPDDPVTAAWLRALLAPTARRPAVRRPEARPAERLTAVHRYRRQRAARTRLVYLSTTGVYGDRGGRFVDETATVAPLTDRARRRVAAERRIRAAGTRAAGSLAAGGRAAGGCIAGGCAAGGLTAAILRVPGIYGAGRLPLQRLRDRVPALVAADDVMTNHIHADDLARLAIAALHRAPAQRILNAVDDTRLLLGDYLDRVAAWAGLPPPPRVNRATLLTRVSPMRATFMRESRSLDNRRMKRELRIALAWPTVAAFFAANDPEHS